MIKEKHKLQKLYNRKPITYGDRCRKMRNSLNSVIRKAKADYFRTKIRNNTHNSRETWRVINSLLGKQGHVPLPKFFVDGDVIVSDPHDIAKGFNDYFANIGPMMASTFIQDDSFAEYLNDQIHDRFVFSQVTVTENSDLIASFKSSSPGYDEISMNIFKDNMHHLCEIITYICNLSFQEGVFPKRLMIAIVTCIFKSAVPHIYKNYRSISILVAFNKILEKAATNRLLTYFASKNLFTEFQFGFRPGVSTADAILNYSY